MKKLTLCFALFAFIITGTVYSQDSTALYKKMDYIHVDSDQLSSFLEKARGDLRNAYQQLVDNGELKDWQLYHVQYPGGEKSHYNFLSIASAPNLNTFQELFSPISGSSYVPSIAKEDAMASIKNSLVKSELWKVENKLADSTYSPPSQYLLIDYMKVVPGKTPDYLMLEDEIAKPIHKERVDKDIMAGWEVYALLAPGGIGYGYNYATGNYYKDLDDLEYSFDDEVINQNMGTNANIPELFNTIYTTRDRVKSELFKLVTSTE